MKPFPSSLSVFVTSTFRTISLCVSVISPTPILIRPLNGPVFRPINGRGYRIRLAPRAGWILGIGEKKKKNMLPDIVKAGDPVLHEPAEKVKPEEIGSDRIQKIIDDMVMVMRKAFGVGLAAPQIGIPLRIIILEYKIEFMTYATEYEF